MPRKRTINEVIKKFRDVHGDKYDYSKVNYINTHTKVCIKCPIHGEFWQTPLNHSQGHGCPMCADSGVKLTLNKFIERAIKVHCGKYDYSKVEYINAITKVRIVCSKHGEFWQRPADHLNGIGCPKCANEIKGRYQIGNTEKFITNAKKVHGNKYDYSKVNYVNNRVKVCIICPKHGEFWQKPISHLRGDGCPKCVQSKLETQIENLLKMNNIKYITQYKSKWLGKQRLDFYLPEYRVGIECQGIQHFKSINFFGGDDGFKKQKYRDLIKFEKCNNENVKLLYFSNLEGNNIITDENKLLIEIKK